MQFETYIYHARWHRCLRSDGLRMGGNWSTRRKPTCLTWWPHDHLIHIHIHIHNSVVYAAQIDCTFLSKYTSFWIWIGQFNSKSDIVVLVYDVNIWRPCVCVFVVDIHWRCHRPVYTQSTFPSTCPNILLVDGCDYMLLFLHRLFSFNINLYYCITTIVNH